MNTNILNFVTLPVYFSDHHAVLFGLDIQNVKYTASNLYWKLNTSLLDDNEICDLFKNSWELMKKSKSNYSNILEWWDKTKVDIAELFKKIGKHVNNYKYGMLNVMTEKLKYHNSIHQTNPELGFKEIQNLKAKINQIKNSTYEEIKVRARIDDKLKGETVSR